MCMYILLNCFWYMYLLNGARAFSHVISFYACIKTARGMHAMTSMLRVVMPACASSLASPAM